MKPTLSKDSETYPLDHNNVTLWIQGVYIPAFPGSDTDPPTNEGMELEDVFVMAPDLTTTSLSIPDVMAMFEMDEESTLDVLEKQFLSERKK